MAVGIGVCVGVGVKVAAGSGVSVGVDVNVATCSGVGIAVGVKVDVGTGVSVGSGVRVDVWIGVDDGCVDGTACPGVLFDITAITMPVIPPPPTKATIIGTATYRSHHL